VRPAPRSIRSRLLLGTTFGVALAFLASGVLVYVLTRASLSTQLDEALAAHATVLVALVDEEAPGEVVVEIDLDGATRDTELFELWFDGRLHSRSRRLGQRALGRTTPDAIVDVTLPDGQAGRQLTRTFRPRREVPSDPPSTIEGVLVLANSTAAVDDAVARAARLLLVAGALGTLLCLALLTGVVHVGLAPLRALARTIAQVREPALTHRFDAATAPPELRAVVARLDELLARLGATLARERELTAEVAHELRTPLAGLRVTIEVALARERSTAHYRETLATTLAITVQTERLVTTLLALARLEAGATVLELADVAVDEVVREALAPVTVRIAERELALTTELETVELATDRAQLEVVVHNLLDNAVAYADHGGTVAVSLTRTELRVTNTGCRLTPAEAPLVFQRFWRGDAARTVGSHTGLGLAMCQRLLALLGGTIDVVVDGDTFTAVVTWPTGTPPP